ncbi:MAG: HEAT repeat domain-containing protein [Anaerolineales bacterium]
MPFGPFGFYGARFDLPEFFTGFVTGLILVWVLIRFKPLTTWAAGLLKGFFEQSSESISARALDNYAVELIRRAETMHAAQAILALSEISVVPRILAPVESLDPGSADEPSGGALAVLPNLPDTAYLSGVYAAPSITVMEAVQKGQSMLLTGPLGSGKSTALAILALQALRGSLETSGGARFLPIMIHANDIEQDQLERKDPLDGLVNGAEAGFSSSVRKRLPQYLKTHLKDQRALILLDGLDELPESELERFSPWLKRLFEKYPGNMVVGAGPIRGYDGLAVAGLAPVRLAPWTDHDQRIFLKRWGSAWKEHVAPHLKRSKMEDIDPALISGWLTGNSLHLSPLEFTLRTWAAHNGDTRGDQVMDCYESYTRRFLSSEEQQAAAAAALAWIESRQGAIYESDLPRGTPLSSLVDAGILVRRPNRKVTFFLPALAAYLAGQAMVDLGVPETVDHPGWLPAEQAHGFYAAMQKSAEEAEHYLALSGDALEQGTMRVGRWLRLAPQRAGWRPAALRALGKIIQDAKRPYGLRLRATHAMSQSKEKTGAVFFRRLLSSKKPSSRILGALGSGGIRDEEAIEPLSKAVKSDPDIRVRQAACLALAAIGLEEALEALGESLLHGEETVRVAAAEALAIHSDEGYEMLKEAATLDDLLTRRAAVFGLARVPEKWAAELLQTMQLEDQQWVVRGAAAEALENRQMPPYPITPPPEDLTKLPWLLSFASRAGLGLAPGRASLEMLRRALNQGTPEEKIAALQTMGWVAKGELDLELKQALNSGEPHLRDAAYEALWRQAAGEPTPLAETEPATD